MLYRNLYLLWLKHESSLTAEKFCKLIMTCCKETHIQEFTGEVFLCSVWSRWRADVSGLCRLLLRVEANHVL